MRTAAVESAHADRAALTKGNTRMGTGERTFFANRPLRKDLALATMVVAERGLALALARGTGSTAVELPAASPPSKQCRTATPDFAFLHLQPR